MTISYRAGKTNKKKKRNRSIEQDRNRAGGDEIGPLGLVILLTISRGKHACSDGVCQTPRSIGICYSKTIQREDKEYTVT